MEENEYEVVSLEDLPGELSQDTTGRLSRGESTFLGGVSWRRVQRERCEEISGSEVQAGSLQGLAGSAVTALEIESFL